MKPTFCIKMWNSSNHLDSLSMSVLICPVWRACNLRLERFIRSVTVGTTSKWISKYPSHPIPATLIRLAHGFLVSQAPQGPQVRWKEECWNFPPPTFSTKIKEEMFSIIEGHNNFLCRPWSALPARRHPDPDTRCCNRKEPPPLGPPFNSAHKHPIRQRFFLKN